jgi:hypothetical protein
MLTPLQIKSAPAEPGHLSTPDFSISYFFFLVVFLVAFLVAFFFTGMLILPL